MIRFVTKLKEQLDIPNGKSNLDNLLNSKGVPYAKEFIDEHLTPEECAFLYELVRIPKNEDKLNEVIESLPSVCKTKLANTANKAADFFMIKGLISLAFFYRFLQEVCHFC